MILFISFFNFLCFVFFIGLVLGNSCGFVWVFCLVLVWVFVFLWVLFFFNVRIFVRIFISMFFFREVFELYGDWELLLGLVSFFWFFIVLIFINIFFSKFVFELFDFLVWVLIDCKDWVDWLIYLEKLFVCVFIVLGIWVLMFFWFLFYNFEWVWVRVLLWVWDVVFFKLFGFVDGNLLVM